MNAIFWTASFKSLKVWHGIHRLDVTSETRLVDQNVAEEYKGTLTKIFQSTL